MPAPACPAAPACTLTVAGDARPWVEEEFLSFDDSFVHSVGTQHTQQRIVLAFLVLHPDLRPSPDFPGDAVNDRQPEGKSEL